MTGLKKSMTLPSLYLVVKEKILKIWHQYKTYEYYQKQKGGKKQIHSLQIIFI
jgi:hypothetical protein